MHQITTLLSQDTAVLGIHVHFWVLVVAGMAVIAALGLIQHSQ